MSECLGVVGGISGFVITENLQNKGYEVALIAGKAGENGTDIANYVKITDLSNKEEILDFFRSHNVSKLVVGSGHRVVFDLVDFLEQKGIITSVMPETCKIAKHKAKYKQAIEKIGLPTPKYLYFSHDDVEYPDIDKIENLIKIPCVVKSPMDYVLPKKANTKEELRRYAEEIWQVDDLLAEEYIYGIDCTIAVTNDGNEVKPYTLVYYSKALGENLTGFTEVHKGHLTPAQEAELTDIAVNAVKSIGLLGLLRVDTITTPEGKHYILETNAVTGTRRNEIYAFTREVLNAVEEDYTDLLVTTALKIFDLKYKLKP